MGSFKFIMACIKLVIIDSNHTNMSDIIRPKLSNYHKDYYEKAFIMNLQPDFDCD